MSPCRQEWGVDRTGTDVMRSTLSGISFTWCVAALLNIFGYSAAAVWTICHAECKPLPISLSSAQNDSSLLRNPFRRLLHPCSGPYLIRFNSRVICSPVVRDKLSARLASWSARCVPTASAGRLRLRLRLRLRHVTETTAGSRFRSGAGPGPVWVRPVPVRFPGVDARPRDPARVFAPQLDALCVG